MTELEQNLHKSCTDTVNRQAAINAVMDEFKRVPTTAIRAKARLESLPAQPEIIRCKDCAKHEYCRTSTVWAIPPKDDWYCADAERRTDG